MLSCGSEYRSRIRNRQTAVSWVTSLANGATGKVRGDMHHEAI
jgi:hypothetical protein